MHPVISIRFSDLKPYQSDRMNARFRQTAPLKLNLADRALFSSRKAQAREIIRDPKAPVLHQRALKVTDFGEETQGLIDDMLATLRKNKLGVALAAPQVGISQQIAVIALGDETMVLVNPKIIKRQGIAGYLELCSSMPWRLVLTRRAANITIEAQDRYGKPVEETFDFPLSIIVQHEIDHLYGILMTERAFFLSQRAVERKMAQDLVKPGAGFQSGFQR